MKRLPILFVAVLMSAALSASPAAAAGPAVANGGGRGTVDGTNPFSQFGFGVTQAAGGQVQGQFNCLMAGASEFPGFDLMAVRGQITSVVVWGSTATFDGAGMFQTGNQGKSPATFRVVVKEGGPGVGTFQLTLLTPFLFVLPTETVLDGHITIH
ncbi:MAG: hypothetical protein ACRDGU_11275 [Actinomycetota bacterium]